MDNIINKIRLKVHQIASVETKDIPFREYVVEACARNQCGMYGKTWQCPPGIGEFTQLKEKCLNYPKAIVFTTVHPLEDSFDIEGMEKGRIEHEKVTDEIIGFFSGKEIYALSAEGCDLCEKCAYPNSPCRFPGKARPSVEANGISVVELAKANGINYKNGNNTVTYFSVVLYK
jgi:predicted metal-binding protein